MAWCRCRTAARPASSRAISRSYASWAVMSTTCMAKWTTTRKVFLAAAMAVAIQAQAAAPDEAALLGRLPPGSAIETRLDADIDGDGIADVAFVGGNDDARWLVVEIGRKDGGSEAAAIHHGLDHPLGP